MIRATAPGKVVLWGEYAVLFGAPALVMAVDRYAVCDLGADQGEVWRFASLGHDAPDEDADRALLLAPDHPASESGRAIAWAALQALDPAALPWGGHLRLDTRTFQDESGRGKLGLGSSAALCTAAYAAFACLLEQPATLGGALEAHRQLQGSGGSGIDVAAAWRGGTLKFSRPRADEDGEAAPWPLPSEVRVVFVFTGVPARTADHLERLRRWRAQGEGTELDELTAAAEAAFQTDDLLSALGHYAGALWSLDQAAGLGIWSDVHCRLRQLALDAGVVYKPCGAGGGDIGAAFTTDAAAAGRFTRLAADNGFLPLALETAPHGIEVTG